jgi:hypothetical protein
LRGDPKPARLDDRRVFRAGGLGGVFRRNYLGIKTLGGKNAPDGHPPFYVNHFYRPFSKREKQRFFSLAAPGCFCALLAIPMPPAGTGAKAELALN